MTLLRKKHEHDLVFAMTSSPRDVISCQAREKKKKKKKKKKKQGVGDLLNPK